MTINVLRAAKHLCKKSEWTLTDLKLQKLIYLANMVYLGETESLLIDSNFEAWERGPVHPDLHEKLVCCGSIAVSKDVLSDQEDLIEDIHEKEITVLNRMFKVFPPGSAQKLYKVTHWEEGAWHSAYEEGKNNPIRKDDIMKEYEKRRKNRDKKKINFSIR